MKECHKILVIDDDLTILHSIEKQLKHEAYLDLDFIDDPVEGLNKIAQFDYDLVICDIRMKPISGIDVLKTIKSKHSHIPIIILTGFVDDKIMEDAKRFGSNDFLIKPIRKQQLIKSIYKIIKAS